MEAGYHMTEIASRGAVITDRGNSALTLIVREDISRVIASGEPAL